MHRYEYTLSDGSSKVIETPARFKEAKRTASYLASSSGLILMTFKQIF